MAVVVDDGPAVVQHFGFEADLGSAGAEADSNVEYGGVGDARVEHRGVGQDALGECWVDRRVVTPLLATNPPR